jgi:hypothetical protein
VIEIVVTVTVSIGKENVWNVTGNTALNNESASEKFVTENVKLSAKSERQWPRCQLLPQLHRRIKEARPTAESRLVHTVVQIITEL